MSLILNLIQNNNILVVHPHSSTFFRRIMSDTREENDGKVSVGGITITNLRFASDIDAHAEEEQELEALVERLDKACTRYKIEISAETNKHTHKQN